MNRMSTNDFRKTRLNEYRKTVLTSDKGRIIDLVTLVNSNDSFLLLTSPFNKEKVKSHLEKYIIADDVNFEDSNITFNQIIIIPENADNTTGIFTGEKLTDNKVVSLNETDFIFRDKFKSDKISIVCAKENVPRYEEKLRGMDKMSDNEFESFRIDHGIPESVYELNEEINPVECGLKEYISFNKGCYIGQEVIARLDSQGKIPKQMVKIISKEKLESGDKIYRNDKETGFVSSTVLNHDNYKALGFIRSTELDFGNEYYVLNDKEKITINISQLN